MHYSVTSQRKVRNTVRLGPPNSPARLAGAFPLGGPAPGWARHLVLGWDTANIAAKLGVGAHTMRNRSKNLRRKLNVGSSLEVVMFAVRMGLLEFGGGRLGDAS